MKERIFKLILKYEALLLEMENNTFFFSSIKYANYKQFLEDLKSIEDEN